MTRDEAGDGPKIPDVLAPAVLHLEARSGSHAARNQVERVRLSPNVERIELDEHGLAGVLFVPKGSEPLPGVILLGGGEGGLHEDDAALLAAHGFAALALAYFGVPGAPPDLDRLPLEYFGGALAFMAAHPRVHAGGVAVTGASFGAAAALLIGATFPEVRAVVSVVGSGVITQGIAGRDFLETMRNDTPPWTYRGQVLPFVANTVTSELEHQVAAEEPVHMILSFLPGLDEPERVAEATIPVEGIRGPVLLISAGDDRCWPCERLSNVALARLEKHRHPYEHQHLHFPNAGHGISPPPFAPTTETLSPGPGVMFELGGTAAANAAARETSWTEMLAFLERSLCD